MFSLTRILFGIVTAITALTGVVGSPFRSDPAPHTPQSTITLHDADHRWITDINANLDRFHKAGLEPIAVDIQVWNAEQTEPCRGYPGLFTAADNAQRVDLCLGYHDSQLGTHLRNKLLLHELAHAWVHAYSLGAHRRDFMTLRDLNTWNDPHTKHYARGIEVAADTIMAMLLPDGPASFRGLCGYEVLTGHASIAGRSDPCKG